MEDRPEILDPREQRLNEILGAYLEAEDAGWAPRREEWIDRYPDLADDLNAFFAAQSRVEALAYPRSNRPRATPGEPAATTAHRPAAPSPAPPRPPAPNLQTFGNYENLEEIKCGGMGCVYKAWQKGANRVVALKQIKPDRVPSEMDLRRFRDEAEAAAALDHPNIVPIYDVGTVDGQLYFTMKYYEHGSLHKHLAHFEKDRRAAAELVKKIALAVDFAYGRGILHRDLKPANIMLDKDWNPYVADFGLAKRVNPRTSPGPARPPHGDEGDETASIVSKPGTIEILETEASAGREPSPVEPRTATAGDAPILEIIETKTDGGVIYETRAGMILGTMGYLPPEQAGTTEQGTSTRCDVYSLGAILYRILTGKILLPAKTWDEAVRLIHNEPARLPPEAKVDPRLEAICLKCLEKAPDGRYESAKALADDLDRWLKGEPPLAWKMPWRVKAWRKVRTHLATAILAMLAGILAATAFLALYYFDPDRIPRQLEAQAQRERVVLIGETGPPRWSRWNIGEGTAMISPEVDKPFSITTLEHGRLELLREAPGPRYRFSAEVRHDRVFGLGWVGIYFAHSQKNTEAGIKNYWWDLTFADLGDSAQKIKGPKANRRFSELSIVPRWYGLPEGKFRLTNDKGTPFLSTQELGEKPKWRQLAVEISPAGIRIFWENADEPVQQITIGELHGLGNLDTDDDFLPKIEFAPKGSLGIYVYRGKASFQNVTITPLR